MFQFSIMWKFKKSTDQCQTIIEMYLTIYHFLRIPEVKNGKLRATELKMYQIIKLNIITNYD